MTTKAHSVKFTYEDFQLFPDDGKRHEIIDGEHYVTPSPITKHQRVLGNLYRLLSTFLHDRRLGSVFIAPLDVVFSDLDVVEPDLLFVSKERSEIITEKNIRGAPDLLVEILSEGTRKTDEIVKRKLYERFGVREYWIVDPLLDSVKVYRLVENVYERVAELTAEKAETLATPLLPGLTIPLPEVFE